MIELTKLEKELLEFLQDDQFVLECGKTWTDFFLDGLPMSNKKARGVLSSLIQKGYIKMYDLDDEGVIELLKPIDSTPENN